MHSLLLVVLLGTSPSPPQSQAAQAKKYQAETNKRLDETAKRIDDLALETKAIRDIAAQAQTEASNDHPPNWAEKWNLGITAGAVLLGFLTLGWLKRQTTATENAANAAMTAADVARDTLHASNRAYLKITDFLVDDFGPGKTPTFILKLTNTGHVPAQITGVRNAMFTEQPLPDVPDYSDWIQHQSVAFPDGPITVAARIGLPTPFTEDDWKRIQSGSFTIAFCGVVSYQAGFDIRGEVGYGVNYKPLLTKSDPNARFALTSQPGYNYSK